jgi:SAM-dependent methyltransferase
MQKPDKKLTFDFFDYKWSKASEWTRATETIYRDWYLRRYGYQNLEGLSDFLEDKKIILEAGCGQARDSKLFAECNSQAVIIAMDQSPNAVRAAKANLKSYPNCHVIRADITNFVFTEQFDFISCDQVLHHTPDPHLTLQHFYNNLKVGGVLKFSLCCKKNQFRDRVDDLIMERATKLSPDELWEFAEAVTYMGMALNKLGIENVEWEGTYYPDIQRFVHNHIFRCWYDPNINFDLSVSSNFDWFSGNPRFDIHEVGEMMNRGLGPHQTLRFDKDDAVFSVSVRKISAS